MKVFPNYKTFYVDIDETLLMSNRSDYTANDIIQVSYINGDVEVIPNRKNINLVVYFYKLGYSIYFWSKTGADWAAAAAKALNLEDIVEACLSKPTFYLDDQDVSQWIGQRRWRDNK